ncbi:sarcosine oxidase subunit gamma family protein [Pistricoccus aurantiacus]|uniref:sarcosine oxidase subunit gamma family protein n=1 Tax=Pistricoccus aurantiacus TaxID=1883414 RepID=UPI0036459F9C
MHPSNFPVGEAVNMMFAKSSAIPCRPSKDHYKLILRRSFANYCDRRLLGAGEEHGVGVKR